MSFESAKTFITYTLFYLYVNIITTNYKKLFTNYILNNLLLCFDIIFLPILGTRYLLIYMLSNKYKYDLPLLKKICNMELD